MLLSYGWRIDDLLRRLPHYVDRILKGTPPGEMPVEQPTRFYTTRMSGRRKFFLVATAAMLARAGSAWSQAPSRMARIGWITSSPWREQLQLFALFTEGMRERGWVEGTNYVLDALHYDRRAERIPALAAELVQRRPDVIVAAGSTPVRPLMQATQTIPIVFVNAGDPVGSGFVSNLARPGGNVTGLGGHAPGLFARQLDLLKLALPRARSASAWRSTRTFPCMRWCCRNCRPGRSGWPWSCGRCRCARRTN
jgi:putative ABC transport system substrate-binding protein